MAGLTRLVPRSARRAVSAGLAQVEERAIDRELKAISAGSGPIVAGPWLGEVGFEILYWVPFLAWFAARFSVDPGRILVLSRGGTASWYRTFAHGYRDVLDYLSPDTYRAYHDARVRDLGEQKQTRPTAQDLELVAQMTGETSPAPLLHPSVMYRLMKRYWWGHLGTAWVHEHTQYRRHEPPPRDAVPHLPESYVAVKFYFNDCFPATDRNRAFVRSTVEALAAQGPVVSLSSGVALDDHGGCDDVVDGVRSVTGATPPSKNLFVQSAVVAHARAFVGTYGGFAYLAPFYGVPSTGYFANPDGYARSHLVMARSAFDTISAGSLLDVRATSDSRETD